MSPFSQTLRNLRLKRNLLQKEAALILGYEQSYLSALEIGTKGTPKEDFVKRVILVFELSQEERQLLMDALNESKRQYVIPLNTTSNEYKICRKFHQQLGRLQPQQIELIKIALNLNGSSQQSNQNVSTQNELEESKM